MVTITKEFTWDMAHILADHQGLCNNLHGHTYRMEVTVTKSSGSLEERGTSAGMVMDFKDLKSIVKEEIVEPLDHAFIYWADSPDQIEQQVAKVLKEGGRKVVAVGFRTTAEMLAGSFLKRLQERFDKRGIKVICIKLWETPTSYAEAKEI